MLGDVALSQPLICISTAKHWHPESLQSSNRCSQPCCMGSPFSSSILPRTTASSRPGCGWHPEHGGSQVLLDRAEGFIRVVGAHEDAIFQKRMRNLARDKRRRENQGPVRCLTVGALCSCCCLLLTLQSSSTHQS